MSRSYRKPYSAHCGGSSARWDKTEAHRGERRAVSQYLHKVFTDEYHWDDVPCPIRLECHHNDVWGWARDGRQHLVQMRHNDYNPYYYYFRSWLTEEEALARHERDVARKLKYIEELKRK